jgi:hypothetical protein
MRAEILVGPERRRRWSVGEKLGIVREAFAPGACVSDVARHRDVSRGQIYRNRPVMAAPIGCRSGAADDGQDVGDGCHAHAA